MALTQRSQEICTSVLPTSKTPVNQKIYHINTLHLYPAKTSKDSKTNRERVAGFLYRAVELPTYDCLIFTENEGLVPGADTGGMQGMHPPTRPKEVLT